MFYQHGWQKSFWMWSGGERLFKCYTSAFYIYIEVWLLSLHVCCLCLLWCCLNFGWVEKVTCVNFIVVVYYYYDIKCFQFCLPLNPWSCFSCCTTCAASANASAPTDYMRYRIFLHVSNQQDHPPLTLKYCYFEILGWTTWCNAKVMFWQKFNDKEILHTPENIFPLHLQLSFIILQALWSLWSLSWKINKINVLDLLIY